MKVSESNGVCKRYGIQKNIYNNRTQSENSWWVSEPLALFHHQVDAPYYQGKSDMYSKSGKRLLPYKQRYNYVKISELKVDPKEDAVYSI